MSEARNNMVAYTEADKSAVASFAFTGALNDQRSYLETIQKLTRFFKKNKRLSQLLTESRADYEQVPEAVKIVAVDILRDAFVAEPAAAFARAESTSADPAAILKKIDQFYNKTGASLGELQYRAALNTVLTATPNTGEDYTAFIIRMDEAHKEMARLATEAEAADSAAPWRTGTTAYDRLIRRTPTIKDTLSLMTEIRTAGEPRSADADPQDPAWSPIPSYITHECRSQLVSIANGNSNDHTEAQRPTFDNYLKAYLGWLQLNQNLLPAALEEPAKLRRFTDNGKSGTDALRPDGKPARCIHERSAPHRCFSSGPNKYQCKEVFNHLRDSSNEPCDSYTRWSKGNGPYQSGKGRGPTGKGKRPNGNDADSSGRNGDGGTSNKKRRSAQVRVDGKSLVYTHCPNWAAHGKCHGKCPLKQLHGRTHKGERAPNGYQGTAKKAEVKVTDVPAKVKRAINLRFTNQLKSNIRTASNPSARRAVDAADEDVEVADFLASEVEDTGSTSFRDILEATMAECADQ